jgi:hypothetical protein
MLLQDLTADRRANKGSLAVDGPHGISVKGDPTHGILADAKLYGRHAP